MMRTPDAGRLLLLAAIWGSSFWLIKVALEGLSPLQIVAGRVFVAALVIYGVTRLKGIPLPRERAVWRDLAVVAVLSNLIPFFLIAWGELRISSSLTAILNSTTPLFTAPLAALFLMTEKLTPVRATGIMLGFLGVVVIVGLDTSAGVAGPLAVVAASASYGAAFVFVRRRLSGRGYSAIAFSAGQMILGSILIALPAAFDTSMTPPDLRVDSVLAVVALGAVGTGAAYILYYKLIEEVGATSASFVTYLIPIFGVAIGHLLLGDRLGWNALAGAAMVIAGIAVCERASRHRPSEPLEPAEASA